jgi:hypothetical protein
VVEYRSDDKRSSWASEAVAAVSYPRPMVPFEASVVTDEYWKPDREAAAEVVVLQLADGRWRVVCWAAAEELEAVDVVAVDSVPSSILRFRRVVRRIRK